MLEETHLEQNEYGFNIPDMMGRYQIAGVINNENPSFLSFMISNGADVNIDLGNGWTPLHEAIDLAIDGMHQNSRDKPSDEILEIILLLVESGAQLNRKDAFGRSPIDLLWYYSNNDDEKFRYFKNIFNHVIPGINNS